MSGAFLPRLKSRVSCAEFMNDERYVVGQVKAKYNGEDQLFDVLDDGTVILPNGETTKIDDSILQTLKAQYNRAKNPVNEGLIVIRYYLALRGAENGVTVMVTPFFCVQG